MEEPINRGLFDAETLNKLTPEQRKQLAEIVRSVITPDQQNQYLRDMDNANVLLEEAQKFMSENAAEGFMRIHRIKDGTFILALTRLLAGDDPDKAHVLTNDEQLLIEATILLTLIRQDLFAKSDGLISSAVD